MAAIARAYRVPQRRLPLTRGDCLPGGISYARPCPFTTCRHHNIELRTGRRARPPRPLPPGAPTCSLDVADEGFHTLEEIAQVFGYVRQNVEIMLLRALGSLKQRLDRREFDEP